MSFIIRMPRRPQTRSQSTAQNTNITDLQQRLRPIVPAGTMRADGTRVSIQDYYNSVTRNSIVINRALREGIDLRPFAMSNAINQPEPSIGVAQQPESSSSSPVAPEVAPAQTSNISYFGRIIRNITDNIQLLSNRYILQRQGSNGRRPTGSARRCIKTKQTLEQKINNLFNISNEIQQLLSVEQLIYFTRTNIIDNYYYRRLELHYTIPFVQHFNNIAQNILLNMGDGILDTDYRYDIEYVQTIQKYYLSITGKIYEQNRRSAQFHSISNTSGDLTILADKTRTINLIVNNIEKDISKEKQFLNNYIQNLDRVLNTIQEDDVTTIRTGINTLKRDLNNRLRSLNQIRRETLIELFKTEQYEKIRKQLKLILYSLSLLCKTFMIIIQKIKFMVDRNNSNITMPIILNELYQAIDYYSRVISYDRNNDRFIDFVKNITNEQEIHFTDIKSDLTRYISRVSTEMRTVAPDISPETIFNFSVYYTDYSSELGSRNIENLRLSMQNPEFEQRRIANEQRLLAIRNRAIEAYNITARNREIIEIQRAENTARRAREAAVRAAARAAAREARAAENRAARQAAREARAAAIAARRVAASATNAATRRAGRAADAQNLVNQARRARTSAITSSRIGPDGYMIIQADIKEVDADDFDNNIMLGSINDRYKSDSDSIITKLRDKYNEYNKIIKENRNKKSYYEGLRNKFKLYFNTDEPLPIVRGSVINFVGYSIPSLFARYILNSKDMKFNDLAKYYVVNRTITFNPDTNNMDFNNLSGIDAGGLRRDLITSLTTELFSSGIFITREGTKKYFLNPQFTPNNFYTAIINTIHGAYDMRNFTTDFYKFLAELVSFILVNDCGLEHNLSSYLTASLYTSREFDKADYLYFMYDDFSEYTNTILNLMKLDNLSDTDDDANDPISYSCISYNDYYNLVDEDQELNKRNITDYLYKCSKFMMTKTILRKDIDIPTAEYNNIVTKGAEINRIFVSNIPVDIKTYLSNIPLMDINSFLVKPTMSAEIIDKLIRNFNRTMNNIISRNTNRAKLQSLTTIFTEYVLKNKKQLDEPLYFKFIDNLIRFWSGSSFYKDNEGYKIQLNDNLSNQHLPQSHTCFFLIDLPDYIGTGRNAIDVSTQAGMDRVGNILYEKIELAITNVEQGIGLRGGKKTKK